MKDSRDAGSPVDTERRAGSGCRLQRLELFNWGTFHEKVWTFDVAGSNALLTGDIGSGKSTLVDAVTTLLLPAHKVSYNKAAGADTRERDLRSYVVGHYKTARNETTGTSRPVGLRGPQQWSVILAVFVTGAGEPVTLAQAFRARDVNAGQPERFYVVANSDMSIAKEFADFGSEMRELRRQLRSRGAQVYDTFPGYGKDLRRQLSIESNQALDLFHQTVSMKAVENLNDFVRTHMLEPFETEERIQSLIDHFDDLTRAHEAVLRARDQLEHLNPLMAELDAHDELTTALSDLGRQQDAVPYFIADRTRALATAEIKRLETLIEDLDRQLKDLQSTIRDLRTREQDLGLAIAHSGGDRLGAIEKEIAQLQEQKADRSRRFRDFKGLLARAELDAVTTAEQFAHTRVRVEHRRSEVDQAMATAQNQLTEERMALRSGQQEARDVNDELLSLQSRRSNLPHASLQVRERLCSDLGIDAGDLPYAGELIQVTPEASDWEGAAERVLGGFALSLLVPDDHYRTVASWIDANHLNARLVYFRVPQRPPHTSSPRRRAGQTLLADLLEVKPDSGFREWLTAELARRADQVCVDSASELGDMERAVTRQGQIKDRDRHVKDDRRRIDDRRHYVLGWSNEQKIDTLVAEAARLQQELERTEAAVKQQQQQVSALQAQLDTLTRLDVFTSWDDIDWERCVTQVTALDDEAHRIQSASDQLRLLTEEQEQVKKEAEDAEQHVQDLASQRGGVDNERTGRQRDLDAAERTLADGEAVALAEESFPAVEKLIAAHLSSGVDDLATLPKREHELVTVIGDRHRKAVDKRSTVNNRIVNKMAGFRQAYPQEALELDNSVASADEYRALHRRVAADDLPRFAREFKDSLNQNTIREIAGFSAQLEKQATLIRERIGTINRSLIDIDYNDGRYIQLVPEPTPNTEVREFRQDLSACTDNVAGADDDQYSEQRFLQVKRIIDRFKGREGLVDQDRTWTRRVTDVRQWFVFSASERWRDDGSEYEHFADSAGKSGGQKEKLAYTILAASLVYQYKLDTPATVDRAFRFVVIDEAFGRGSEVSTRYALDLFSRLGLQLLIVTPLQKIHVIEPHVSSVGYVDNVDGGYSRLQSLTITDYRRRRAQLAAGGTS